MGVSCIILALSLGTELMWHEKSELEIFFSLHTSQLVYKCLEDKWLRRISPLRDFTQTSRRLHALDLRKCMIIINFKTFKNAKY